MVVPLLDIILGRYICQDSHHSGNKYALSWKYMDELELVLVVEIDSSSQISTWTENIRYWKYMCRRCIVNTVCERECAAGRSQVIDQKEFLFRPSGRVYSSAVFGYVEGETAPHFEINLLQCEKTLIRLLGSLHCPYWGFLCVETEFLVWFSAEHSLTETNSAW